MAENRKENGKTAAVGVRGVCQRRRGKNARMDCALRLFTSFLPPLLPSVDEMKEREGETESAGGTPESAPRCLYNSTYVRSLIQRYADTSSHKSTHKFTQLKFTHINTHTHTHKAHTSIQTPYNP